MHFHVLGPLRVTVGDEALALGAPQQQKLLALLCATPNEPVSADRLIDEIWGEVAPPSAHHLVQVYVSRLRKLLGGREGQPRVARNSAGYLLRVESDELDSLQLAAVNRQVERIGSDDPAATWRILVNVVDKWRGTPFGELADESDALRLTAIRLTESYLGAVENRIEAGLELGLHRELVGELEGLVTDHPYREGFWRQLMISLYRSGRQVEALRAFRTLRIRLEEDLGIEPGPVLTALEGRMLLHDVELLWEPPPPPSNLPADLNTFIGRGSEVAAVRDLLEASRLVTLTGPGGIGKTRLAIETARRALHGFADGVLWVDLAPVSTGDEVIAATARTLGVSTQRGATLTDSVIQSLVRRRALIVFDNCEHVVVDVAALVEAILRSAGRIRILATSRVPLRILGESLRAVPALAVATTDDGSAPDQLPPDAVQLFVERGVAIAPHFQLDDGNVADIREVCRRLDGMPLAIEMAAARLTVMSPREIADALSNRFDFLTQLERDSTGRHQTLHAALDWSYDLLDPEVRIAFDNLAVFPGSFDLEAAGEIATGHIDQLERLDTVATLVDASMVTLAGTGQTGTRFRLLETLRSYAAENLRRSDSYDRLLSIHARRFLSLFAEAASDVGEPEFAAWKRRLDEDYADVRQALDWSLRGDTPAEALQLAPPLVHYWYRTGDAREARLWGLRMLAVSADAPPGPVAAAHSAVAFGATIIVDDPAEAQFHTEQAIDLYRKARDPRGLVFGYFGRANTALLTGDIETVRAAADEGLALADEIGYSWGRGACLSMQAFAGYFSGTSLHEARATAVEGVSLLRNAGDVGGQVVMNMSSAIALKQGDLDSAERYALDTAVIAVGSGWEATALDNLAQVYIAKRDIDQAEATLQRAIVRALDAGLENWFRMTLRDLAQVACHREDNLLAARLIGASRRNMPMWGLDPSVYEGVESSCIDILGAVEFKELSAEGYDMEIEQLLHLAKVN